MQDVRIHRIRIGFSVTPEVKRFVCVYVLEAQKVYLVDSGTAGSERQIEGFLRRLGRKAEDVGGIFLTHAHPDHIGTAAWFRERSGCPVYASEGERPWIEDIDLQFRERPIPNFYGLAGRSCPVDACLRDGEAVRLEAGLEIRAAGTPGHSQDHMAYRAGRALFTGDAVPVKGGIPILVDEEASRATLRRLAGMDGIEAFHPAWDESCPAKAMQAKLKEAEELLDRLKAEVLRLDRGAPLTALAEQVCASLGMPRLAANPLFARTLACLREPARQA